MSDKADIIETDGEPLKSAHQRHNLLHGEGSYIIKSQSVSVGEISMDTKTKTRQEDLNLSVQSTRSKITQDTFDSGIQCSANSMVSNFDTLSINDKFPIPCSEISLEIDKDEGLDGRLHSSVIEVDLFVKDDDGDTLIHTGIVSNRNDLTNILIDIADDVKCLNIQNELHQSPLHLAVLTSQQDIVQKLVLKGANVYLRDKQGNTALHIACLKGDEKSVRIIVDSFGKDTKDRLKYLAVKNFEGLTCLHIAAQMKEYMIMGYLFAKGIDVNIGDAKSGRTILHYAVERNDFKTVSLLLTHPKIDIDYKTFKGETPLIMAYWRNYKYIVKKLKLSGAYFSYDIIEDSDEENV